MMFKFNLEKYAREEAASRGLAYGMSVFDGKWYVGTPDELDRVGAIQPGIKGDAAPITKQ